MDGVIITPAFLLVNARTEHGGRLLAYAHLFTGLLHRPHLHAVSVRANDTDQVTQTRSFDAIRHPEPRRGLSGRRTQWRDDHWHGSHSEGADLGLLDGHGGQA